MKIITDTSTLFSPKEGQELGIDVLPLHVVLNNVSYKEFVDINSEEFVEKVSSGLVPTSSQPSVGETMAALEKYPDEEILVISMADGLSGTYQSTLAAKENVSDSHRIHVVNSMTLCGPHRYLVQNALAMQNDGATLQEIIEALTQCIAKQKSFLIPQDFGFLSRGGRLTPLAAKIGGLLKIVPVMMQTEDGKRLEKFVMKRTFKGAIASVIQSFKDMGVDSTYMMYVSHAMVQDQAELVKDMLQSEWPENNIEILELSPAFITQGGPGCLAIQVIEK